MPAMTEEQITDRIAEYLRGNYGETLVRCEFLQEELNDEGTGTVGIECTVRVGASESDWQKTFTFRDGEIADMTAKRLG